MTLICSSKASPWNASTVTWLRILRAGLRLTGTLLWVEEHNLSTEVGGAPDSEFSSALAHPLGNAVTPHGERTQPHPALSLPGSGSPVSGCPSMPLTFLRHSGSGKTPAGCPLSERDLEGNETQCSLSPSSPSLFSFPCWASALLLRPQVPQAWLRPFLRSLLCAVICAVICLHLSTRGGSCLHHSATPELVPDSLRTRSQNSNT